MSRLKGADLGISAGALNYRGDWTASPSPAYAANDLVVRNSIPYVATKNPGGADPAVITGVITLASLAAASPGTLTATCRSVVQQFNLSSSVTVDQVTITAQSVSSNWSGTLKVGIVAGTIASGTDVTGLTFVASGTVAASAFTAGTPLAVSFGAPIALAGGAYTLVIYETSGSGNIGSIQVASGTVTQSGLTATTTVIYGPGTTTGSSLASYVVPFSLQSAIPAWKLLIPSAPLNNRGKWTASPSPTYGVNDTVTDGNTTWIANTAVPAGAAYEPSLLPAASSYTMGAASGITDAADSSTVFSMAAPITVSTPTTVAGITLPFGASASGANIKVGIATAIGANDGAITWLGATPATVAGPGSAGSANFNLPAPLSLLPGNTYYVVLQVVSGGASHLNWGGVTPTLSGAVASYTNISRTASVGGAWSTNTFKFPFTLYGTYWTSLGASAPMNYRGVWTATPATPYAANDVVLYNGALYAATASANVAPPLTASAGGNGAAQNLVVTLPTTFKVGDLLIFAQVDSGDTLTGPPAGWTQSAIVGAGGSQLLVHTKIATAADIGATITWNWSNTDNGSRVWLFRAYSGVLDTITSVQTAGVANSGTANDTTVTPTAYPATIVHIGGALNTGTGLTLTPPALSNPNNYGNGSGRAIAVADETLASGTSTARAFTQSGSGTTANVDTVTLVVKPLGAPGSGGWQPLSSPLENINIVPASGATQTLPDVTTATMHKLTLTANCTVTLPAPGAGKSFTVELAQDATGGRTVTWATPSGAIRWPGGTAPTITATANAIDVVTFVCIGGTNWYGFVAGQAFA